MALSLPPPTQPITNPQSGMVTEPWYRILAEISRIRSELDYLNSLTVGLGAGDVTARATATVTATFVGST
jgi:hypothetical protein